MKESPHKLSRRQFGRLTAAGATFSLAGMLAKADHSHLLGQEVPGCEPAQQPAIEAKLANILRKYGSRLSESDRATLRRILAYHERLLAGMRAFPLKNGDPPVSVLQISFSGNPPQEKS